MSGLNPSTVWVQLALPVTPAGAIPFVDTDMVTIDIDVANLWWDNANNRLSLGTNGDQTGTDALNLFRQGDSFLLNSAITGPTDSAATPGWTVSSARGTIAALTSSLSGDFVGKFSGWSLQATFSAANFAEMAGVYVYANGATAGNLGGELHFLTRANAGLLIDRVVLDNTGELKPTTAGVAAVGAVASASARLGAPNFGWAALSLDYALSAAAGAVIINKPAGQAKIALGAASVVVTNSLVTANSIVLAQLATADATLTFIKSVVCAAGSFTVTGNANATADTKVSFIVIGTDS